jgi:hypothetical protein
LEVPDGLSIEQVTKQAYASLGNQGIIKCADNHTCSDCTHPYKRQADHIAGNDPAGVVGVDENRAI